MPTIRMLKTEKGSPDGLHVQKYEKGQEYDLSKSLSDIFLKIGSAELVVDKKAEEESPYNKAEMETPMNAAVGMESMKEDIVIESVARKRKSFKRK